MIEGRRVRLRGWRLGDSARVVEGCCDPVTAQWLGALPRPYGPNDALEFLSSALATTARGTTVHWALADPGADEVIGAVTLMHLDLVDGSAELGYWTHPDARARGVMKEAAWWAVRHALLDPEEGGLGLRLVRLRAAATNVASCRVAERVGFRRTGVEPAAHRLGDGSFVDQLRYQVRAEELAATLP
ncbi:MAG TPA: GNAT family N-acetyltransferase [Dermatophilaceae bacterium]|nr:GNAT family N-acetyltransferase [Dermatophilaceae bacterium]